MDSNLVSTERKYLRRNSVFLWKINGNKNNHKMKSGGEGTPLLTQSDTSSEEGLRKRELAMCASLACLAAVAADIYVPAMPAMEKSLEASSSQLIMSLYLNWVVSGFTSLLWGPLSDAIGRVPAVLGGLSVLLAGTVLSSVARDASTLIGGRVLQGAGEGMGQCLAYAIVRDVARDDAERRTYIGIMVAFQGVFICLAPAIGGLLATFLGWRSIFHFLTIWAFLGLVAFSTAFRETNRTSRQDFFGAFFSSLSRFSRRVRRALTKPRAAAQLFTTSSFLGGRGSFIALLTYTLQNYYHQSTLDAGLWLGLLGAGAYLGGYSQAYLFQVSSTKELEAFADKSVILFGLIGLGFLVMATFCFVGWGCDYGTVLVPVFAVFIYMTILCANTPSLVSLLLGYHPQAIAGALSGFYAGLKMIVFALSSFSASILTGYVTPHAPAGDPKVLYLSLSIWIVPPAIFYWFFARRPLSERDKPLLDDEDPLYVSDDEDRLQETVPGAGARDGGGEASRQCLGNLSNIVR